MESNERNQLLDTDHRLNRTADKPGHAENRDDWWFRVLKVAGYIAGFVAQLLTAASFSSVQAMGKIIPGFELNAWRFVAQFLLVIPIIAVKKPSFRMAKGTIPFMCIVCVAFNAAGFGLYESAKYLPIGIVGCLLPTLILIVTSFVDAVITRSCRIYVIVAVGLCVAGSVLYAQPAFLFGGDNTGQALHPLCGPTEKHTATNESILNTTWADSTLGYSHTEFLDMNNTFSRDTYGGESQAAIGYTYVVLSSVTYSVVILVSSKKLKEVSSFVTAFWAGLSASVISIAFMAAFETPVFPSKAHCQGLLMSHAFSAGFSLILALSAMALLPPTIYALMTTLQTVFYCLAQYTVLRDISPARGNALEITGAALVLIGNAVGPLYRMYDEFRENQQELPSDLVPLDNCRKLSSQEQTGD